ncbi:MAG: hypothetical protein HY075_04725 [Deltaproteobacteria bacterium]|nr:hypothetical protein [Deltaproteobacteria bacterium]
MWNFALAPGLLFALSAVTPNVARANVLDRSSERAAVLRGVFGVSVEQGLANLRAARFQGAADYALELAFKVKAHALSLEAARGQLLAALQRMDKGEQLVALADVEVVGVMPVGASVANRLVPGVEWNSSGSGVSKIAAAQKLEAEPELDSVSAVQKDEAPALESAATEPSLADDSASPNESPKGLMVDESVSVDGAPAADDARGISSTSQD